jgi:hypothetical protein
MLPDVVARRLARGRNCKGFANVKSVLNMVGNSIKASFDRQGKDSPKALLKIIDCLGKRPDPDNLPELKEALAELESMTGLEEIKKAVDNLVKTAQTNYDRELRGEKTLDVTLNRLFMGNPGTGTHVLTS